MASTKVTRRGRPRKTGTLRRKLKTLKRMEAKVAATRRDIDRVRMETAHKVAAMEEMRMELDYQFDVMLLVLAVDSLGNLIRQL